MNAERTTKQHIDELDRAATTAIHFAENAQRLLWSALDRAERAGELKAAGIYAARVALARETLDLLVQARGTYGAER